MPGLGPGEAKQKPFPAARAALFVRLGPARHPVLVVGTRRMGGRGVGHVMNRRHLHCGRGFMATATRGYCNRFRHRWRVFPACVDGGRGRPVDVDDRRRRVSNRRFACWVAVLAAQGFGYGVEPRSMVLCSRLARTLPCRLPVHVAFPKFHTCPLTAEL